MKNQRHFIKLNIFLLVVVASGLLALVAGCPTGVITPPPLNQNPTANAGVDQNVDVGERVALSGLGSTDPDDDPLTYLWEQRSGPSVTLDDANSAQASFLPVQDGFYEFALTVSDGRGGSGTSTVRISVGDVDPSTCPRADAGVDQMVNEGGAVTLRGRNSADPSGNPVTYEWFQLSGPQVSINGVFAAEPGFVAPQVTGADTELEFELSVTNEQGCPDTDTVVITVTDRDRDDPCSGVVCNDDGQFCNGVEICENGVCRSNGNPCLADEICDEGADSCMVPPNCTSDTDCDDGLFCNGAESCVAGECQAGASPCTSYETCDDDNGACVDCLVDSDCDGGLCTTDECIDGECVSTPIECGEGVVCDPDTGECGVSVDGLVAYYPFEGDARDASGNGNHGSVSGATLCTDRRGNLSAYCFDGVDDEITIPSAPDLEMSGAISVAAWVHPTARPPARSFGTHSHVLSKSNSNYYGGGTNYELNFTRDPDSADRGWFNYEAGTIGSCYTSETYAVGDWYHVVGVYDPTVAERRIYVNGVLSFSRSTADQSPVVPNTAPLVIGYGAVAAHFFHFEGTIDEVRIYSRVLSDSEIRDLGDDGTDGDAGLVAYYPFEGDARDASGNGHHGSVNGATLCADRRGDLSAYCFDGVGDQITIPSAPDLEMSGAISVAAWIHPTSRPPARSFGTHSHILSKSNSNYYGGGTNYELNFTRDPDSADRGWFNYEAGTIGNCYTSETYAVGDWYHVVGVYDPTVAERRIYVNGVLSFSRSTAEQTSVVPNSAPLVIGYGAVAAHFFHFEGTIDEVRIYSRVINDSEIRSLAGD